jgi:hypothetical protein
MSDIQKGIVSGKNVQEAKSKIPGTQSTEPFTRLSGKEFSPLIIRRYSMPILHFVAIITDDSLDDLDSTVRGFWVDRKMPVGIQEWRNLAGELSEVVAEHYPKTEGLAIIISADKMLISSLAGDFMCHLQCRLELYTLLNIATNV